MPDQTSSVTEAVALIYRDYLTMVWGILGRARIFGAEREDLAHDVFVLVHRLYPRRDPQVPVYAWLAAISWNVIRNHRALARVQREAPMAMPETHEPVATEASPEERARDRERILALLDGMDDDQRAVLDMHAVLEIELPDVARALGIPEGTARTRLRLAREHVRAADARLAARAAFEERRSPAFVLPMALGAWKDFAAQEQVPPEAAARVWRAVGRSVAAGLGGAAATAGAGAAVTWKAAVALLGLGALLGGGGTAVVMGQRTQLVSQRMQGGTEVSIVADHVPTAAPEPSATPAPPTASSIASARPPQLPARVDIDPEEVGLVQRASAALARRNYNGARAALREHETRFPRGQLLTERKRLLDQIQRETDGHEPLDGGAAPHRMFGTDD